MNNEEKILALLSDMQKDIKEVKEEQKAMRVELEAVKDEQKAMRVELEAVKEEQKAIRADLEAVKEDLQAVKDEQKAMRVELNALRKDVDQLRETTEAHYRYSVENSLELGAVVEAVADEMDRRERPIYEAIEENRAAIGRLAFPLQMPAMKRNR